MVASKVGLRWGVIAVTAGSALSSCSSSSTEPLAATSDPAEVTIRSSDVALFWSVFDSEGPPYSDRTFLEQYVANGSAALKAFRGRRPLNFERFGQILNDPAVRSYYLSIREASLALDTQRGSLRDAFENLKSLYPAAVFTDVTFVVGGLSTGGTLLEDGQIVIGAELFMVQPDSPLGALPHSLQSVLRPPSYLVSIVVHELIHVQQARHAFEAGRPFTDGANLLKMALIEGGADFVTDRILGVYANDHLPAWANGRQAELWEEFRIAMNGTDLSRWLFNRSRTTERPADLGYYIGYKIAEARYDKASDKAQAIRELIEVDDAAAFLAASGYADRF